MKSTSLRLLSSFLLLLQQPLLSTASPISSLTSPTSFGNETLLEERGDCTPCGFYSTACCYAGEVCYTDQTNDQASCSASAAPAPTAAPGCASCGNGGSWVYWTSTFTSTDLVTYCSTYSSYVSAVPTATWAPQTTAAAVSCDSSIGQTSCGPICCASYQYCKVEGQCAANGAPGYSSWQPASTWAQTTYNSYTAPLRPTSVATQTFTSIVQPTTTVGFEPAVTTGANVTIAAASSGGGLSGGAIAGIVIGVIIGIIILILLCLCLCAGAAASTILGFFRGGNKKQKRTEEVEYYHRHGSRADGRTWYGGQAAKPQPKKKSGGLGFGTILAGLAAFAAALSFGRRKRRDEKSDYSSSYGSYTSYTASSSDRRTRDSRRSRR